MMNEHEDSTDDRFEAALWRAFHFDPVQLALYVTGMATSEEAQAIADHVGGCDACQAKLDRVREDAGPTTPEETEAFLARVRAARSDRAPRHPFRLQPNATAPVRLAARAAEGSSATSAGSNKNTGSAEVAPGLYRAHLQPEGTWKGSLLVFWCDDEGQVFLQFVPEIEATGCASRLWCKSVPYDLAPAVLAGASAPLVQVRRFNVAHLDGEDAIELE